MTASPRALKITCVIFENFSGPGQKDGALAVAPKTMDSLSIVLNTERPSKLAEDIKANGLREPLVLAEVDGVWMLIDGRNRRAACKIAGVEPTTRDIDGEDPTAFVLSANVHRRNISTGQRAMAIAMLYPEPTKGGRGKKGATCGEFSGVSHQRVADARVVLRYCPELAQAVMRGEKPLHGALAEARLSQGDSSLARIAGGNFLGSAVF